LPPETISLLTGDPDEIGRVLLAGDDVDMLTFTGSARVGRKLARAAGMVRSIFELGDSGALIALDDADVAAAAAAAVEGAFRNSGQSCRGVKRIIADEAIADELAVRIAEGARQLRVGDPRSPETDVGTLIDERAAAEVERRVEEAVAHGAQLLAGGERSGAQYPPTVLDHVDHSLPLTQEETFGPVAPIVRVRGLDQALACANDTRYGLQAGLFTRSVERALRAFRELEVGAVIVNGGPNFDAPNIPFGGVKDSGIGREGVRHSIIEMTMSRTLVL
jgi:aldehyde dehydrogenase (NAD+)/aldehyde dehydrogenase